MGLIDKYFKKNHIEVYDEKTIKTYGNNLKYCLISTNPLFGDFIRKSTRNSSRKKREEMTLKKLKQKKVSCVPEYISSDKNSITMSTLRGEILRDIYKDNPNEEEVLELVRSTAKSVKEIHDTNLYHGDVLPKNIIVNNGKSYLFDLECEYKKKYEPHAKSLDTLIYMFKTYVLTQNIPIAKIRNEFEDTYGPVNTECMKKWSVRTSILHYCSGNSESKKAIKKYKNFKKEFYKK